MSHDLQGREYAKIKDVKEGDILEADGGFTCIGKKEKLIVYRDQTDGLFVRCSEGQHYLDGQEVEDYYIGLYFP